MRSIPELPLWMGLSAALPVNWSPLAVFFGLTLILGLVDWPGLARAVRSKLLSLREEDYCTHRREMVLCRSCGRKDVADRETNARNAERREQREEREERRRKSSR